MQNRTTSKGTKYIFSSERWVDNTMRPNEWSKNCSTVFWRYLERISTYFMPLGSNGFIAAVLNLACVTAVQRGGRGCKTSERLVFHRVPASFTRSFLLRARLFYPLAFFGRLPHRLFWNLRRQPNGPQRRLRAVKLSTRAEWTQLYQAKSEGEVWGTGRTVCTIKTQWNRSKSAKKLTTHKKNNSGLQVINLY